MGFSLKEKSKGKAGGKKRKRKRKQANPELTFFLKGNLLGAVFRAARLASPLFYPLLKLRLLVRSLFFLRRRRTLHPEFPLMIARMHSLGKTLFRCFFLPAIYL